MRSSTSVLTVPALLVLAAVLLVPALASAQTTFRGTINTDTIWRAADSPITLTGDVTVAPHATLTIEPGTEIRVATSDELESGFDTARVEFIVRGTLVADGTSADPILIRSTATNRGRWFGIVLAPDAQPSSLRHVEIRQALRGIWGRQSADVAIEDVRFIRNETSIQWDGDADLTLDRVTFRQFREAIVVSTSGDDIDLTLRDSHVLHGDRNGTGIILMPRVNARIERTDVIGTGLGLDLPAGASLHLTNSIFAGNALGAMRLAQGTGATIHVLNNTIDLNVRDLADRNTAGTGIHVTAVTSAGDFIIRNNSITRHGTAGISRAGAGTPPAVDHNNAWGNGTNYQGLSEGIGSISVNPLYRNGIAWAITSVDENWYTTTNATQRSWSSELAHRFRHRVQITRNNSWCNSVLTTMWVENGSNQEFQTGATASFTGWTAAAYAESVTSRYNRTTGGSCITSSRVNELEWAVPDVDNVNYRVEPSSPLVDAGSALLAPDVDRDGSSRPFDGNLDGTANVDMGAYEWRENVPPVAVAGPTSHLVLPGTEITFDGRQSYDPDGTIVRHTWSFGTDDSVDEAVVTRTFDTLGSFTITLTVEDDRGETDSASVTVEVADNLPPIARLGSDRFAAVGEPITFDGSASSDPDGTIVLYEWTFGDDSPGAAGLSVSHSYARAGVFEVTLTVTDNRGATGSASIFAVIGDGGGTDPGPDPAVPPTAHIALPISGIAGSPVTIDASGSTSGDAPIASWTWDFGDGQNGAGETTTHTWTSPGSYLVRLTVTDEDGETDSDFAVAQIAPADSSPATGPTARAGGPYSATLGGSITFDASNSTAGDADITEYRWDFGDGNTGTGETVSHTYAASGGWLVRLTVTDNTGLTSTDFVVANVRAPAGDGPDPVFPPNANGGPDRRVAVGEDVTFDGSDSASPNGDIVQWRWNFGDGSTADGVEVTHSWSEAGTWLVRLTVTDVEGLSDEAIIAVQVGSASEPGPVSRAPVAIAGPSRVVETDETITLDGSDSYAIEGELVQWNWDLGDGTTDSGETITHAWTDPGLYIVRLTVTDDNGATANDLTTVTVTSPDGPIDPGDDGPAPVANAGDDVAANAGTAITFSAANSTVRDPLEATYAWDFGDGTTADGLSTRHTWDDGGLYTVTLTVRDDRGRTSTDTLTADINALPIAHAGGDRNATTGQQITLDGGLSHDPDGQIVDWSWRLGDGTSANGETVSHTWQESGTYTVTLTVEDDRAARSSATAVITVTDRTTSPDPTDDPGDATGDSDPGDDDDDDASSPSGKSGGCSATPTRTPAWPALLLLAGLAVLRRRR